MKSIRNNTGIGLVEVIVYAAFLAIVLAFIINTLMQVVQTYQRARADREVIANGRALLETVQRVAAESFAVYGPTSRFQDDAGQLSLVTAHGAPPEHQNAYQDFYVDNNRLWFRKEGEAAYPLSAASVRVSKFYLERIMQGLARESVKVTLRVDANQGKYASSIELHAAVALRGNY